MAQRPSRILALDGGGVRGWSQILLLGEIIYQIKVEENNTPLEETQLYPCEYFDLIVGSGTGGINAILIGRLGMSISDIKMAYKGLKEDVFSHITAKTDNDPLFDHRRLETWAKALVRRYTGDEDSKMVPEENSQYGVSGNINRKGCKIAVTSRLKENLSRPELFRSYNNRFFEDTTCTIWEAIRATTAFPILFEHIFIGPTEFETAAYTGGDLLQSNPIDILVAERDSLYRASNATLPPHGCIVSLGTGKPEVISLGGYRVGDARAKQKLVGVLKKTATNCEGVHQKFGSSLPPRMEAIYFRFNVEQGLQKIADSDWGSDNIVGAHALNHMANEEYTSQFEDLAGLFLQL